jgi:hypothetical protein
MSAIPYVQAGWHSEVRNARTQPENYSDTVKIGGTEQAAWKEKVPWRRSQKPLGCVQMNPIGLNSRDSP